VQQHVHTDTIAGSPIDRRTATSLTRIGYAVPSAPPMMARSVLLHLPSRRLLNPRPACLPGPACKCRFDSKNTTQIDQPIF
jgi:hypothetical protein